MKNCVFALVVCVLAKLATAQPQHAGIVQADNDGSVLLSSPDGGAVIVDGVDVLALLNQVCTSHLELEIISTASYVTGPRRHCSHNYHAESGPGSTNDA